MYDGEIDVKERESMPEIAGKAGRTRQVTRCE